MIRTSLKETLLPLVPKISVVLRWRVGRAVLEEGFERQGSGGVDVGPDGVGKGERSDDGVGAEGLGGWSDGQESYKE